MTDEQSEKDILICALMEILEPKGAYSRDPTTYRGNVIDWIQDTARKALKDVGVEIEPDEHA